MTTYTKPNTDWFDQAACKGRTDLFFPPAFETQIDRGNRETRAKAMCRGCPVLAECTEYMPHARAGDGVIAGTTYNDRRRARRHAEAASKPPVPITWREPRVDPRDLLVVEHHAQVDDEIIEHRQEQLWATG